MKTAIGIDIGGTKVSLVLGTADGTILEKRKIRTRTGKRSSQCIDEILLAAAELKQIALKKKSKLLGVGVGVPGAADSERGTVPRSPHLDGWQGIPLAAKIKQRLKVPVVMANDANAAALAEKIFGDAKKCQNFIYMTVSTGVGGGIVVHGKLLEGASFVAGEIGHMTIETEGEKWKLGEVGCLEAYASGTAIARYVKKQLKSGKTAKKLKQICGKKVPSAKEIAAAAKEGDKLCLEAFKRAGTYLGVGIGNLLNILNPEKIILGGGVMKTAPSIFRKSMLSSCKKRSWPEAFRAVEIRTSRLKGNVGDLGAMALVFEKHS